MEIEHDLIKSLSLPDKKPWIYNRKGLDGRKKIEKVWGEEIERASCLSFLPISFNTSDRAVNYCRSGLNPAAVKLRDTSTVGATSGRLNASANPPFSVLSGGFNPIAVKLRD